MFWPQVLSFLLQKWSQYSNLRLAFPVGISMVDGHGLGVFSLCNACPGSYLPHIFFLTCDKCKGKWALKLPGVISKIFNNISSTGQGFELAGGYSRYQSSSKFIQLEWTHDISQWNTCWKSKKELGQLTSPPSTLQQWFPDYPHNGIPKDLLKIPKPRLQYLWWDPVS